MAVADTAVFRDWLIRVNGLGDRTATVYAALINYGQRHGDVTAAIGTARSTGTLKVVQAAVRWWSKWTGDRKVVRRAKLLARERKLQKWIKPVTVEEREKLNSQIRMIEEPYRSAMVVVACSGLRLRAAFLLSRELVEIGRTQRIPLMYGPVEYWTPQQAVQEAFKVLLEYGGWELVRDLFGRDYFHAYGQVAEILREACKSAGVRRIRPAELGRNLTPG